MHVHLEAPFNSPDYTKVSFAKPPFGKVFLLHTFLLLVGGVHGVIGKLRKKTREEDNYSVVQSGLFVCLEHNMAQMKRLHDQ